MSQLKHTCGVPKELCNGGTVLTNKSLGGSIKAHGTSEEAFKCHKRYLLSQGYEQIGSRDFRPPDGGPILILSKKSKFGGKLRKGKADRWMPKDKLVY